MENNWNLEVLYTSFDSQEFLHDMKKLDHAIQSFTDWSNHITQDEDNSREKLEEYINKSIDLGLLMGKLDQFTNLTLSVDATNEEAEKYRTILVQKSSLLTAPDSKVMSWISNLEAIKITIASSELLKQHEYFLNEIVSQEKYRLSEKEEDIISHMENTGSTAWENYKDLLIATHTVLLEENGVPTPTPLTKALNLATDASSQVRKSAYEAELASYKNIEAGLCASLNAIKGEVLTVCKMRGYESPLEMSLTSSRMSKKTLDALWGAIEESLPSFRKYLRKKAEVLGHKNGLPWYDMYAPVVDVDVEYSYDYAKKFVVDCFRSFSDNLADYADHAINNRWIDVYPKEGKVGGAFCAGLDSIKECRFLLNYGDSFNDISTMAHEIGHGFHNWTVK
ncbi:MAG: oligoendopeptidase F, partial [Epulopiscium sp. Nele67-Bin005]